MKAIWLLGMAVLVSVSTEAQTLPLPPRATNALSGREFVKIIAPMAKPPAAEREDKIFSEIAAGNVPGWLRQLKLVTTNATITGVNHTVSYYVTPDYMAIGSDQDYFLTPMTPLLAQRVANSLGCTLPTRKMVNDIWSQARVKMTPTPIPPSPQMITIPIFDQHNTMVWTQRVESLQTSPLGSLVAGDKKDVVISSLIYTNLHKNRPRPVVIYGWHFPTGKAIQPLFNGHQDTYADYSHGIRLVQNAIMVDGAPTTVTAVLTNPALAALLSDETNFSGNLIQKTAYPSSK